MLLLLLQVHLIVARMHLASHHIGWLLVVVVALRLLLVGVWHSKLVLGAVASHDVFLALNPLVVGILVALDLALDVAEGLLESRRSRLPKIGGALASRSLIFVHLLFYN